ncbi:hypothetical protein [Nonomuraea sp. NPDC049480]|uniref:hypothetical protein n=1 Tax=Nonomuraea sp. NPDC049480 TaxID=3364353 RepID=UPI003789F011
MTTSGPDVARSLRSLDTELETAHNSIVDRTIEIEGVEKMRTSCNKAHQLLYQLRLGKLKINIDDAVLLARVTEALALLKRTREAMGRLIEVLKIRDNRPKHKLPADFERRHGAVESEIEDLRPILIDLAKSLDPGHPSQGAHSYTNPRVSVRIPLDEGGH